MIDQDTLKDLQAATGIAQAQVAIASCHGVDAVVALPEHFKTHDLEALLPNRRRARGMMTTESIDDFAKYVEKHAENGATVFVESEDMSATAMLNLGTPEAPGHADNCAKLSLRKTSAYSALQHHASGSAFGQQKVAEFLEDWQDVIVCHDSSGNEMRKSQAVAAIRAITIEAARNVESEEQQLSASKSSFESVTAKSKHTLPQHIHFLCAPYHGLSDRIFALRLGILTGGDQIGVVLRIIKQEMHDEEMTKEFADRVANEVDVSRSPVFVGSYNKR